MTWPESPGFHDGVPDHKYHAHKALGSSGVAHLLDCPATYRYLADHPEAHKDTEATEFGTACHAYILEGEAAFASRYFVTPLGFSRAKTKADAETVAAVLAHEAAGGKVIKQADYDLVRRVADAVFACADAAAILKGATGRERSVLFTRDGVPCKARLDVDAIEDMALVADLKCLADPRPSRFLSGDMGKHRAIQASFYSTGCHLAGTAMAPDFAWIVAPTEPPFARRVWVAQASDPLLRYGDGEIRRALTLYKSCVATNDWAGYDEEIRFMEPPARWVEKEVAFE